MLLPETEFPCMKIAKYVFNRLLITFVVLDAYKVLGSRIVIFGIKAFRSLVNPLFRPTSNVCFFFWMPSKAKEN